MKKEFAVVGLDLKYLIFIIYVVTLSIDLSNEMHPSSRAQIVYVKANKAFIKVLSKYTNFGDIFLSLLTLKLLKYLGIKNYAIKLVDDQIPLYSLIYSLRLVKLEILKTYIKNNLVYNFIRLSKFFTRAPIFFDKKLDKSLR